MNALRHSSNGIGAFAPVLFLAALLGGGILQASYSGPKWLVMTILAYFALAVGVIFKDKRLFLVCLVAACIPIGFQYNLWSHGSKGEFISHFGGALDEPVINLVDLPIALMFGIWILDLRLGTIDLPRWTGTDTLIVSLLGVSMFSLFNTEAYLFFWFEILRYLKYLGLYWMLRTYITTPVYFWSIIAINIGLLSIQGLVSLMQYFLFFEFPIPVGGISGTAVDLVDNELIQRVTGILGHSNTFSAYLMVICSLCLVVLFARIKIMYKLAVMPMFCAGIMCLILTFSRNGWMVFVLSSAGICGWALKTQRLKTTHVAALVCASVFIMGILFVSGIFDTILTRIFRTDNAAFDSRGDLMLVAFEMIKTHPFTGIGLNSFEENMIHYDPYHITHVIRQPVHNGFLLVAAETGIPAMLILIAILVSFLKMSWAILKKDTELDFTVGLTGVATFAGLALSNLFDVTLRKESIAGTIVIMAAMISSQYRLDKQRTSPELWPKILP